MTFCALSSAKGMDIKMQEKIRTLIMAVVFVVCLALIMIGQKNIGVPGLIMELAGLVGLLTLLFIYNNKYK